MAVSGYSNNLAYPHMSNGNTYLLVPACSLSLYLLEVPWALEGLLIQLVMQ
ncbi:hypothetical protein RchiOBHm_Chr1g0340851 [Rosa chinensis]|uniref:Uncharacterized protein n=1 Tax=Rosa chinensis TaxID=74649 RepID=A0A2P6SDJ9_ROSCH|nr:hypothetical protein RchiOBHm_Chr1g0340851 [Rosa chinensis]